MKVTGETITDEQIRESGASPGDRYLALKLPVWPDNDTWALGNHHRARARCAEIWNARHGTDGAK